MQRVAYRDEVGRERAANKRKKKMEEGEKVEVVYGKGRRGNRDTGFVPSFLPSFSFQGNCLLRACQTGNDVIAGAFRETLFVFSTPTLSSHTVHNTTLHDSHPTSITTTAVLLIIKSPLSLRKRYPDGRVINPCTTRQHPHQSFVSPR